MPGIGEKTAPVLLSQMGSMQAVWADIDHCDGANLVATLDSFCEEEGLRRVGAGLLKKLIAPGARERFEFNLSIMSGRTDLDLGLTPDVPGTPGLLPLEADRVARVVGYLGVPPTTQLALRVLTEPPASTSSAPRRSGREVVGRAGTGCTGRTPGRGPGSGRSDSSGVVRLMSGVVDPFAFVPAGLRQLPLTHLVVHRRLGERGGAVVAHPTRWPRAGGAQAPQRTVHGTPEAPGTAVRHDHQESNHA